MTIEDLKKLDKRLREIQYPFGENYPQFRTIFSETASQQQTSVSAVIQNYVGWKYGKR